MKREPREVAEALGVPTQFDRVRWETLLSLVDYKPGWQFSLVDLITKKGAIAVRFKMLVWDTMSERDLHPIVVTTDYQVPKKLLGKGFSYSEALDWLRDRIGDIEHHERDEWFRFDGLQCFNPHGPSQQLGRRVEGWEWMSPEALSIVPHLKEKPRWLDEASRHTRDTRTT